MRSQENGKWYVAKLEKSHKHELVTPSTRHSLRSHKPECDTNKRLNDSGSSTSLSDFGEECGKATVSEKCFSLLCLL